ncbi:T9SS type A sorting domain-containing protein [Cryomorphaceae bacterium 1068]|nr:T9SS type A sorting domain-containing protein [Cryomorphaceae bacterium 1068]
MRLPFLIRKSTFKAKVAKLCCLICTAILVSTLNIDTYAQCYISIQPSNTEVSCLEAVTPIVWTDLVNVTSNGSTLSKINGGNNWNGGAASATSIGYGGSVILIVESTGFRRMFGLAIFNTGADQNSIRHTFHLENNGTLRIREFSSNRGTFGTYNVGDTLRIEHTSEGAHYYRNDQLLYVSSLTPIPSLIVDVSLRDNNATLGPIFLINPTDGRFTFELEGEGTGSSYQWFRNGTTVGTSNAELNLAIPEPGDTIACLLMPGSASCFGSDTLSNYTILRDKRAPDYSDFYITSTPTAAGCLTFLEEVIWDKSENDNLEITENDLKKVQFNGNWNGGIASLNTVHNNGYFEFVASETNRRRMAGISDSNINSNYNTIDYAFYLDLDGNLRIYENGSNRGSFGTYSTGDTLRIAIENETVHYYQNGMLLRIAPSPATTSHLVDVSIRDINGTIQGGVIANLGGGSFSAFAGSPGSSPTYQWFLNSNPVGTNSPNYVNTTFQDGDLVTCQLTPDAQGCQSNSYVSTEVEATTVDQPLASNFYISGSTIPSACQQITEEVVWDRNELLNVEATGNSLSKVQNNGSWNGGAASLNRIGDNGYFEFVASETNKRRMAGLSDSNINSNFNTIDFAFYLDQNTSLRIYENGSNRGTFGNYSTGDTLKIAVINQTIHYYKNSTLLRIAPATPTLPLLADISIRDINGTITDATVTNNNAGAFEAFVENAGPSPSYQWLLNGNPVGSDSPIYTNTSIETGDVVTCELNPDIAGCTSVIYQSNSITCELIENQLAINFYISNAPTSSACRQVLEEVVWNNDELVNLVANGNNLMKIQGGNSWTGGAASSNTVNADGYFEFVATETNSRRMAGLSDSNVNSNFNTIDFAFYLQSNSNLGIYENGSNRGNFGTYSTGDTLRIAVKNGSIHYYRNQELLRIATATPSLPLLVDVSMRDVNGTISKAAIANFSGGDFTAHIENAGASPTYQWYLNDNPVGGNSNTYSNPNIEEGDEITCEVTPDLGGCTETIYTSNVLTVLEEAQVQPVDQFIATTQTTVGYAYAEEDIVWDTESLENVEANGNSLVKVQSNNNWNGGAASKNTVYQGGYFEFTTAENDERKMVGISTSNTSSNQSSIDYAFYLEGNGNIRIFESGAQRGFFGTYSAGDLFRISLENSTIRYFRNGALLREVATMANSLLADVSIRDIDGTVTDAIIGNLTNGDFIASIADAGASPDIQWQLNGSNVGSGNTSYSNTNLVDGNIITCSTTPDFSGCTNAAFTSNQIRIIGPTALTTWTGAVNSNWSIEGNWTMGTPNQFISASIPGAPSNQPELTEVSEVNDIEVQAGASLSLDDNSLLVSGDFDLNGTFSAETGTVVFRGLGETEVSGSEVTFNRLVMNKTNLGEGITLNTPIRIQDETVFIRGNIRATTNDIIYENDADSRTGLNISHVEGFVRKIGNDSFTFPVGSNGIYAPISISSPDNITDEFVASYYDTSADEAGYNTSDRDPSLVTLSQCEYWILDREAGNSSVAVSLAYEYERSCGTSEPADLRIARWSGSLWQNHGYSGHQGDSLSGSVRSGEEITEFSPFTFGSGSFNNPLPIELIFFDAYPSDKAVKIDWTTATELNNDFFTIERSADAVHFERVGFVNGNGNSTVEISYSFIDDDPLSGTSYYRLKQTDFDGQFEIYPMVPVTIQEPIDLLVFPNPALEKVTIQAVGRGEKLIRLINFSGVEITAKRTSDQTVEFDVSDLAGGLYIVEVSNGSTVRFKKLIIQ